MRSHKAQKIVEFLILDFDYLFGGVGIYLGSDVIIKLSPYPYFSFFNARVSKLHNTRW